MRLGIENSDGSVETHEFRYHTGLTPITLKPSSGPLAGGSVVTIQVDGLALGDDDVRCSFAGHGRDEKREIVLGRTLEAGRVVCVAPEWRVQGGGGCRAERVQSREGAGRRG